MMTTVLCLLSVSLFGYGFAGASNWLLESSFQAKPITMISDQVSSMASSGVNVACQEQLDAMLNQRPFRTFWPMQMLDSNAQLPSGVMRQTFTSVGSYKQCLQIHSQHQNTPVDGQFCFLTFSLSNVTEPEVSQSEKSWLEKTVRINNRFRFAFGICVPNACSKNDLTLLFANSSTAKKADLKDVQVELCQTDKPQPLAEKLQEYNNNIAFPVLILTLAVALLGTLLHLFGYESHWLGHLSIIKSTKGLFSAPKQTEGSLEYRLRFCHGIRFWSMAWIFSSHSSVFFPSILVMPISYVSRHPFDMQHFIGRDPISALLSNGFYAVQSFFFLSGFLLVALIIEKNAAKKIDFFSFVAARWIRFVIPVTGIIVLHKIVFMLWKGPFFSSEISNTTYSACNDNEWWKNLLFISNFTDKSCIRTMWFLSADLQIHIVAFVLVLALRRSSYRWVYSLSYVLASMSIVIPLLLLHMGFSSPDFTSYFDNNNYSTAMGTRWLYYAPYMHMGAYFYGTLLGTLLMRNDKLLARFQKPIFWASIIGTFAVSFYKVPSVESLGNSHLKRGLLNGACFGVYNLGLGMILFQLALPEVPTHARWLNRFLTHPFHIPISRLSFSLYLTQYTVLILNFSLVDDVHHISIQSSVTFSLSCLIQTVILSWIHFVLFESPSHHLIKALISLGEKKPEVGKNVVEYRATDIEQEMVKIEVNNNSNNAH